MKCSDCGIEMEDDKALVFLHNRIHSMPTFRRGSYDLNELPYSLWPAVARAMQDYADSIKQPAEEGTNRA